MKLGFSLLLILAIAVVYYFMSDTQSGIVSQVQDLKLKSANASSDNVKNLQHISNYNAIVDRPLFIEQRRFEEEKTEVVVKPKPVIQELLVQALGIALTADGILAVIKDSKNGKTLRLRIGDEIYGWTLKGVSESSFTFSKDEREKVINFKE